MKAAGRNPERGVVLVNVLAVVALASTVLFVMLTAQSDAIRRSRDFSDAAAARAAALGGVTSAVVALRRDLAEDASADHALEAWAALAEEDAEIDGGVFTLEIQDAQGRFNVNNLRTGGIAAATVFQSIVDFLAIPADQARQIVLRVTGGAPLRDMGELAGIGLSPSTAEAFSLLVTALPDRTTVNINAANEALIALILKNPVAAGILVRQRDRAGFLEQQDLERARILMPPGMGFTSDHFRIDVSARIGDTAQRVEALIGRSRRQDVTTASVLTLKWKAVAP